MLIAVITSFLIIIVSAAIPLVHFFAFPVSPFISGFIGATIGSIEDEKIVYFGILSAAALFLPLFLLLELTGILGDLRWYFSLLISFILGAYVWFGITIGALIKFWTSNKK